MISFKNAEVFNFEGAVRGMRNPFESWEKSDSGYGCKRVSKTCQQCKTDFNNSEEPIYGTLYCYETGTDYIIGEKDLKLMQKLIKAGSDHRKFMRQIIVSVDITAPLYWWKEFDTYKVGTVANSTSTMHTIQNKEFTDKMFSWDRCYIADWKQATLANLNYLRARYKQTKDKKDWYALIQMLPSSYNQTRTVTMNYENLFNMYHARKNHKLDEWREFCKWVEKLDYAEDLIIK